MNGGRPILVDGFAYTTTAAERPVAVSRVEHYERLAAEAAAEAARR